MRLILIFFLYPFLFQTQSLALTERAQRILAKGKPVEIMDNFYAVCLEKNLSRPGSFKDMILILKQSPDYQNDGSTLIEEGISEGIDNVPFEFKRIAGDLDIKEPLDNPEGHELIDKLWEESDTPSTSKLDINSSGYFRFMLDGGFLDERLIILHSMPELARWMAHNMNTLSYVCQTFVAPTELAKSKAKKQMDGEACTISDNTPDCIPEGSVLKD